MDDVLKQTVLQQCVLVKSEWDTLGRPALRNRGLPAWRCHGLCEHIIACSSDPDEGFAIRNALRQCFRLWPEYSGDPAYPVPSPDGDEDDEYDAECAYDQLNLWTGAYGEARKRLLDFIIQTLSEELHNAV